MKRGARRQLRRLESDEAGREKIRAGTAPDLGDIALSWVLNKLDVLFWDEDLSDAEIAGNGGASSRLERALVEYLDEGSPDEES